MPVGLPPTEPSWLDPCHGVACDRCNEGKSLCPDKCDFFLLPPRCPWYVLLDGVAMRHDLAHDRRIASVAAPTNVVLSTDDLTHDFRAGGRSLIGHTCDECFQIEGLYLGVSQSDDFAAVRNTTVNPFGQPGYMFSPFGALGRYPIEGLDYNNFASIHYYTSLTSVELNIRRRLPMPPQRLAASVLFGVRYMGMPEEFNYHTESAVPDPGGSTNAIQVRTDNQMVGPQIGGRFEFYIENRWWVNVEVKGAVMNDRASTHTDYVNTDATGPHEYLGSRTEDHTAFLGDVALTFIYRWSPHFCTRLGYQALWLERVALAPQNLGSDINILKFGPAQLDHTGHTVFHGPHAGISISW